MPRTTTGPPVIVALPGEIDLNNHAARCQTGNRARTLSGQGAW